jgi:predicted TIM-barrel fold metal-dependent hydrolase
MSAPPIDACIRHRWVSESDVIAYMSRGWQEFLNQPTTIPRVKRALPVVPLFPYHRPDGDNLPGSTPESGPAGSSPELVREQLLDRYGIARGVLSYGLGMYAPLAANPHLAREFVRAANDWTIERWLSTDDRLSALILVPTQTPDDGAAEIHRLGANGRLVGVLLAANGLSKPFGHPLYHPIFRAAAEWDLPIVIHAGGDAPGEALSHPAGGGLPTSYGEYYVLRPQSLMTHIGSLIAQGVFLKYSSLRVLVVGGGVAWFPGIVWRLDTEYRAYRREMPWLDRPPSEYVRDFIRISTYPLDVAGDEGGLRRLLETFGGFDDLLVYGSGYPSWDFEDPESPFAQLPGEWRDKVLHDNARAFFRWDASGAPSTLQPPATVGAMGEREEGTLHV